MQTIDINEMRGKLLTLDQARERLEPTEHLSQYTFDTDGSNAVSFNLAPSWNVGLKEQDDLFVTQATINIDGFERYLTKEAAMKAFSEAGLPEATVLRAPNNLLQEWLNHFYANGLGLDKGRELKLLASEQAGLAFTRATINPYSNLQLMDAVIEAITEKYGESEVLVDYKFHHDLSRTNMRLIVPSHARHIASARAEASNDPWSVGIELRNSITGADSLELSGYLFAWWCTNGATSTAASSGKYRRRPTADPSEAYDWARSVVDEVLGGLEGELDAVEALTQIPLEGELNETLHGIFEDYKVPTRSRDLVLANLVESDDLTAYGLMNAITAAANNTEELSAGAISQLLVAGGNVAHHMSNRCTNCHGTGHVGHNH